MVQGLLMPMPRLEKAARQHRSFVDMPVVAQCQTKSSSGSHFTASPPLPPTCAQPLEKAAAAAPPAMAVTCTFSCCSSYTTYMQVLTIRCQANLLTAPHSHAPWTPILLPLPSIPSSSSPCPVPLHLAILLLLPSPPKVKLQEDVHPARSLPFQNTTTLSRA